MKKLVQIALAVFVLGLISVQAEACEKHAQQSHSPSSLPSDSLYHLNSKWSDQENRSIQLSDLAGKPRLVAMVYTKCQTACPLLVRDVKAIISRLPKKVASQIRADLFSFDSESENSQSLQAFHSKYKLDDTWSAYFGGKSSVAELAAVLGIQYKKLPTGEYIHANVIFLINGKGEIVSKHEGLGQDTAEFVKKIEQSLMNEARDENI